MEAWRQRHPYVICRRFSVLSSILLVQYGSRLLGMIRCAVYLEILRRACGCCVSASLETRFLVKVTVR